LFQPLLYIIANIMYNTSKFLKIHMSETPDIADTADMPEGPKIELNEEMRSRLQEKLNEYERRLVVYRGARDDRMYQDPRTRPDLVSLEMKIPLLQQLLHEGVVDTFALSRVLSQKSNWSPDQFTNACAVIEAYNKDDETRLTGGTGLPAEA